MLVVYIEYVFVDNKDSVIRYSVLQLFPDLNPSMCIYVPSYQIEAVPVEDVNDIYWNDEVPRKLDDD